MILSQDAKCMIFASYTGIEVKLLCIF